MEKSSSGSGNAGSGIGFFGLLTIALIVLKLIGVVSLSWKIIALIFFAPLFIVLSFLAFVGVVYAVVVLVARR